MFRRSQIHESLVKSLYSMVQQLFFMVKELFLMVKQLFFMVKELFLMVKQLFFMVKELFLMVKHSIFHGYPPQFIDPTGPPVVSFGITGHLVIINFTPRLWILDFCVNSCARTPWLRCGCGVHLRGGYFSTNIF